MKIIISPAKKMMIEETIPWKTLPHFIEKTEQLKNYLSSLNIEDLKKLLACNDSIAELNYERYSSMDLKKNLSPAILSYDGIQYKYMSPSVFSDEYFRYIENHLRIISGFYGILRPFDGIVPYRLEMHAKLKTDFCRDLYDYWGDDIYKELTRDDKTILNLASSEYSKTITKYAKDDAKIINCIFGEETDGKVREKGVYVKMARGEMVRYMAENAIEDLDGIRLFDRLGFSFSPERSDDSCYVFLK